MEFFETILGRRYYEHQLPQLIKQLSRIADSLEKLNEDKDLGRHETLQQEGVSNVYTLEDKDLTNCKTLENIAEELAPFEPALARLLRHYVEK